MAATLRPEYKCSNRMVQVDPVQDYIRAWSEAPGFRILYCFHGDHTHTFTQGLVLAAELAGVRQFVELGRPSAKLVEDYERLTGKRVTIVQNLGPAGEALVKEALRSVDAYFGRMLTDADERHCAEFASRLAAMGRRELMQALYGA